MGTGLSQRPSDLRGRYIHKLRQKVPNMDVDEILEWYREYKTLSRGKNLPTEAEFVVTYNLTTKDSNKPKISEFTKQLFEDMDTNRDSKSSGPEIPEYESIHIKMKGYDFVVLEAFAKYVHRMGKAMEFETESLAIPSTTSNVKTYKSNSSDVQNTYSLKLYQRVVELQDVPSTKLPIFVELLRMHTPEGIQVAVQEPTEEDDEYRFIPDREMESLQTELEELGGPNKPKKK